MGGSGDQIWKVIKIAMAEKSIEQRMLVNTDASQSAIWAFSNHFWYMTAEMVPLALFSSLVPLVERQALCDALLKVQPSMPMQSPQHRFGSGWGKPQFPSSINLSTRLCDLVDTDSWITMFRLQINSSFLHLPIAE